jgi:hypothetical protein
MLEQNKTIMRSAIDKVVKDARQGKSVWSIIIDIKALHASSYPTLGHVGGRAFAATGSILLNHSILAESMVVSKSWPNIVVLRSNILVTVHNGLARTFCSMTH